MKATAFSSQSVTTFADAVVIGVNRHAASNNHALLRVMAVLRDVTSVAGVSTLAARCPQLSQPLRTWGFLSPVTTLGLLGSGCRTAATQVLGLDLKCSESSRSPLPFAPSHTAAALCSKGLEAASLPIVVASTL